MMRFPKLFPPIIVVNLLTQIDPSKILKLLQVHILKHLTDIFNLLFSTGAFPNSLKSFKVILFHKINSKLFVSNYGPISFLCNKIIEKLMYN